MRFIGRLEKLGFTVAICGKEENGSMICLRVSVSDPSFSSVSLCMDEEEYEEKRKKVEDLSGFVRVEMIMHGECNVEVETVFRSKSDFIHHCSVEYWNSK